ncbi:MAG: DNA-3-methyladenine glycosylase 2 family protein [Rhodobacteraceae bacterium]|nr:DNA-3-methyladenine glycosylase 2 family protein [Paracoccaceae bacterium]
MVGRIILNDADVAEGAAWLSERFPKFAYALTLTGLPPLRLKDDGFTALLSAIVSQQISVAAARGIWGRLEAAGAIVPEVILAMEHDDLRGLGLSNQKAVYAKALAERGIDFAGLRGQRTDMVVRELTAVKGIGIWTAEVYAMFSLGRADVFASGDLALQEAAKVLFDLDARPKERALREMAEAWSPWRSVAARILWAYYHVDKKREGIS